MAKAIAAIVVLLAQSASALAQGYGEASAGFAWANVGLHEFATVIGAGGETSSVGVSAGADVGLIMVPEVSRTYPGGAAYAPAATVATVAVHVSNHFNGHSTLRPFVAGGLTFLLAREAPLLFDIRGGVDRWLDRHMGVRVEVQDQFVPSDARPAFLTFRAGVILR